MELCFLIITDSGSTLFDGNMTETAKIDFEATFLT